MTISIIVAIGKNFEIGKDNAMLAHLPADLKYFKETTQGHTVIMGRKTFESLPKGALPNRRNIVISRNPDLRIEGAEVVSSLDQALVKTRDESEVFIMGGAQIYALALPIADRLYITKIHTAFPEAQVFFPTVNFNQWKTVSKELYVADQKNPYDLSFLVYER